jgi:hypothetical protein
MVKRGADVAINTGKAVIQDASDFFYWASEKSNFTAVEFRFVGESVIVKKVSELSKITQDLKPVPGTMKLHAVVGDNQNKVWVRNTSCYCSKCLMGVHCNTWRQEQTRKKKVPFVSSECTEVPKPFESDNNDLDLKVDDYVAAIYDSDWYVGKILEIDEDDGEIQISFMEKKKQLYQWPRRIDSLWVGKQSILCTVDNPTETGKSKRLFKLPDLVIKKCSDLFSAKGETTSYDNY